MPIPDSWPSPHTVAHALYDDHGREKAARLANVQAEAETDPDRQEYWRAVADHIPGRQRRRL